MMSLEECVIQTIEDYRHKPFNWATFNCALASATMAEVWTGIDYAAEWRPLCSGRISSTRIVLKNGWSKLMTQAGLTVIDVEDASIGDFVLTEGKGKQQAIGVVYSDTTSAVPTIYGMGNVQTLCCATAFTSKK
tara:strand:- start:423 stop:824 length:402 start_codon:yes stop_codon:yes gene_type:complete